MDQTMLEFLENDLGLSIVKFFQQGWLGDLFWYLLYPFHLVGSEMGFLLLMPVIYWSVNKSAGKRLFILALAGTILTGIFKGWWHRPRPFHVAPGEIEHITTTLEPGLPSGHTIFGTVIGLWILNYFRDRKVSLYMVLFILLMGVSRLVHGMHYPQDVILGWVFGGLFFWIYYKTEPHITRWFEYHTFSRGILVFFLLWISGFVLTVIITDDYETRKSFLAPLGALAGGIGGIFLDERFIGLSTPTKLRSRLFRGISGIIMLLAVYFLLDLGYYSIFEGNHSELSMAFYMLRYLLVGLSVTCLIPLVFRKFKL